MKIWYRVFSVTCFLVWAACVIGFFAYALRHGESLSSARTPAVPVRELR